MSIYIAKLFYVNLYCQIVDSKLFQCSSSVGRRTFSSTCSRFLHSRQSSSQTPAIGKACSNAGILTIALMQTMLMLLLMLKLLLVDLLTLFILVMLFQTCAGLQSHPIFPCSRHLYPVPRPTQLRSKPPHLLPLLCQYWSDLVSTFRISILI